ncbi:Polar amino acid transport system substrate-binding protein [Arthrobacter sp. 9V]|uniref:ABC transporter substrate-binding protein n=1 Tax=Arthrobacter sp. 9V TaxID=2653132 RepID=UPI0012F174FF|nr:ABC transporter substrate-binding protein [Arthrobacter sp. 9V]VXB41067.1 Polar amino acid transport system substrate-binding protein [Arthrobacter sp. 9V]
MSESKSTPTSHQVPPTRRRGSMVRPAGRGPGTFVKGAIILTTCVLALSACTNASGSAAGPAPSGSSNSTFDAASVTPDQTLASQVPAAIKSKGTLIIGSDTTYAPAEFLGGADNRTPMGYGVDLAKAIGATLDLKVDVQTAEFTGILPALGPKYDLGISSFSITNERLEAVNFVSYLNAGTTWAVRKGNPKKFSPDDVCGKSVGVQTGTTQEDPDLKNRNEECIKAGKQPINIVTLKNQTDVTTRLVNGSLDAMIAESTLIGYAVQQTGGAVEKAGGVYNTSPVGIAVPKNDTALAELVQKVVAKLIADGSYQRILDSWNNSDGAITSPEVNPAVKS